MLVNHLKIAARRLGRNRFFFLTNLSGLAIGITACIFIIQYVNTELSYDHFNKNIGSLYRVVNDRFQQGQRVHHSTMTYSGMGRAIADAFPEVEQYCRVTPYRVEVISYEQKKIADPRAIAVDQSFLSMFSHPLLAGDPRTALIEPNSLILTEKLARTLNKGKSSDLSSLIGQVMVFDRDSIPYKITAICKDVPENSSLPFDLLMSYVSLYSNAGNNQLATADYDFTTATFWHYIQLKPGADVEALNAKLPGLSQKLFSKSKAKNVEERFFLQPLSKAYLYSDFEYEIGPNGSSTTVWSLMIIAAFILALACINYINLATAKSVERAREVGVRKVIGATRPQLIRQFLSEAMLLNLFALIVALVLVQLLQEPFNRLLQKELSLASLFLKGPFAYSVTIALFATIVLSMFISGLYPAFVLSYFKPVKVLKGIFGHSNSGIMLRKWLVIGQFTVTIILITGSFVVYRQIRFMNSRPLGYDMEQMLILRKPVLADPRAAFSATATAFIAQLEQLPNVKGASITSRVPGDELNSSRDVYRMDRPDNERLMMGNIGADTKFLDLYKIKLLAGRNFAATDYNENPAERRNVILNESAMRALGFNAPEESLGRSIMFNNRQRDVIGVVGDFHQKSLKHPLEPIVITPGVQGPYNHFSVKVNTGDLTATITEIERLYAKFFPGNLFDYSFLDQKFGKQYANDRLFGRVFRLFAVLAMVIAGLGLLGLSLISTARRAREIGVRKVLGATVSNMVLLLSRELLKPVLIATVIATPIAWYIMQQWLLDFAYRIEISVWLLIGMGLLVLCAAFLMVSVQTIRTAVANPVKSLRAE
jgi:putative ABC transport system permease protein